MAFNRFRKKESLRKRSTCTCGSESRLIKRNHYPHGRKSVGSTSTVYHCDTCNKEVFVKAV